MLKLGPTKTIGTPVRCPSCRHPNLAIDIWCERCGTPLDWKKTEVAAGEPAPVLHAVSSPRKRKRGAKIALPRLTLPAISLPRLSKPSWMRRAWSMPRLRWPALAKPAIRLPRVPHIVLVVALVLAVLLLVPLAYVLMPTGRPVAGRQGTAAHLPATKSEKIPSKSPQAAAIAAVQAKTGLKYSTACASTTACLSLTGQTIGKDAAAFIFTTAHSGGRECVAYVYQKSGAWHTQDAACALPGQLSPLVGHDATVHVPGNCANVRDVASLSGQVSACLYDGSAVHVDGGPVYADDFMWWHTTKGWMAHDFLVAP